MIQQSATGKKKNAGGRPRTRPVTEVGVRITRYAENRGWTVLDLAREANVSSVSLYGIIGGTTPDPRVSTLRAVADALGVTLDRLWPRSR